MKKQDKKEILEYAIENYKASEDDIARVIRVTLVEYPITTKIVYWVDARRLLHENGYTYWKLDIPSKWLEEMNANAFERNKTKKMLYIDRDAVQHFMNTQQFTYDPYFSFIQLLLISGRRSAELLFSSFETRNNDTELWFIPKKKKIARWYRIEHLLCDYTPKLFIIELERFHTIFNMSTQTLRVKAQVIMNNYFNTTHLHLCRSMYVLLLRDKFKIQPNNLPYYVGSWLCHETNGLSSLRYIQCEWTHNNPENK